MSTLTTTQAVGIATVLWLLFRALTTKRTRSSLPLPPSPPSDPIIGHARLLLGAYGTEDGTFHELGKKYGPIVFMSTLGQSVAVVNDLRTAEELLEKRGSIYCSRTTVYLAELMGVTQSLPFMPYGEDFRRHRKMFQKYFRQDRAHEHQPTQVRETQIMLQNITGTPKSWSNHLLRYATAIIIDVGFGHIVSEDKDPYIEIADDFCQHVLPTLMTSDPIAVGMGPLFRFLQYFPSWFPLAHYPRRARQVRKYAERIYDYPLADVEKKLANGTAQPSFLVTQLEELRSGEIESGIGLEHIQGAAAITYVAGAETTSNSLAVIIAAMVLHPEYQYKVQDEIDKVVGASRLPDFKDRDSLPYLEHVLQEAARWQPIVSLQPHQSIEDDVYNGMFIPKGTVVIANARGMTLDEAVYRDPLTFNPDRYIPKPEGRGEPYPAATFGFGRRICPGRYLGGDSVWIAAACLLATMRIGPAIGADGIEIAPEIEFEYGGATSHPKPFQCSIQPRSEQARQLISGEL